MLQMDDEKNVRLFMLIQNDIHKEHLKEFTGH